MQNNELSARAEIELSDEQALLSQSATDLLSKQSDMTAVRRNLTSDSGYDAQTYKQLGELGWLGLAVPAAYGGSDLPVGALVSVFEPMGKHLFASPFLATTLATQILLAAGSEEQKQRWLPKLISGDAIGSVAFSEPSGSFAIEPVSVRATRTVGGFSLQGEKTFALDAQHADFVIVSARTEHGVALFLVERAQLAGRLRPEVLIDETRRSARIKLDGLTLGHAQLLAVEPLAALQHVQRVAWLLLAAEMSGGAEGVLQLTLEYLKTRKQFGKLIGGYQALKHPMVDIMCSVEQGRSLLYHAATAFDRKDPEREIALRMAKAQLGDTYTFAADRSIQFHGAIGFTYECHAQLYFRRAQWAQHSFGDSLHHRRKLADLMWPKT